MQTCVESKRVILRYAESYGFIQFAQFLKNLKENLRLMRNNEFKCVKRHQIVVAIEVVFAYLDLALTSTCP